MKTPRGHTADQSAQFHLEQIKIKLPQVLEVSGLPLSTFNTWMQRSKDPNFPDIPPIPDLEGAVEHQGHRKSRLINGLGAIFIITAKRLVDGGATIGEALAAATRFAFVGEHGRRPGGIFSDEKTLVVIERFADGTSRAFIGAASEAYPDCLLPASALNRGLYPRPISWLAVNVSDFLPSQCAQLGIAPVTSDREADEGAPR